MGQLEGGLLALEWSPDGETVCLITGAGQMLLMTKVRLQAVFPRSCQILKSIWICDHSGIRPQGAELDT